MSHEVELTTAEQIQQAWHLYRSASGGLNDAYDAAIEAALADLGKATSAAYEVFDAAAQLAWEALTTGTAEARHLRDRAISQAIDAIDPATRGNAIALGAQLPEVSHDRA